MTKKKNVIVELGEYPLCFVYWVVEFQNWISKMTFMQKNQCPQWKF